MQFTDNFSKKTCNIIQTKKYMNTLFSLVDTTTAKTVISWIAYDNLDNAMVAANLLDSFPNLALTKVILKQKKV